MPLQNSRLRFKSDIRSCRDKVNAVSVWRKKRLIFENRCKLGALARRNCHKCRVSSALCGKSLHGYKVSTERVNMCGASRDKGDGRFNFMGFRACFLGCTWQGKACQLVVNHEEGFALYVGGTRGTVGNGVSPGSPPTPLWRRSFDKLKMSADDGARLLWLDFGGEDGEIVSTR